MFSKMIQGTINAETKQTGLRVFHVSNLDCIFLKEAENKPPGYLGVSPRLKTGVSTEN